MSKSIPWVALFLLLFLIAPNATARDFFGGFSPLPMWLNVDYGELNDYLEGIGVAPLDDGAFLMGWSVYLYVHPSVRVGLMGTGGSRKQDGRSDLLVTEARSGLGFLGGTAEYVFSFMQGDVAIGTMLGYGHADIELRQRISGPIDWDEIWNDYLGQDPPTNFGTTLKGNFFAYQPFIRTKYKLTSWLSLQGSVGYLGAKVGKWSQWGDVDIKNEPSLDFGGLIVTLGPHLGF